MKRSLAIVAAVLVALCLAGIPAEAEAKTLQAARPPACSLPYVEDVNEWGPGKVVCTVVCYGGRAPFQMKVVDAKTKKRVKVTKHKTGVWSVVLRKGRTYKVSVRAKGCGWKSIRYGVER